MRPYDCRGKHSVYLKKLVNAFRVAGGLAHPPVRFLLCMIGGGGGIAVGGGGIAVGGERIAVHGAIAAAGGELLVD